MITEKYGGTTLPPFANATDHPVAVEDTTTIQQESLVPYPIINTEDTKSPYVTPGKDTKPHTDMSSLSFGEALKLLEEGKLVCRKGWNGKGMFIFQRPEDTLPTQFIEGIKSLPQSVKDYYRGTKDPVKFTAYLCMKAADGTIVNGWLASQTDMTAKDWQEFSTDLVDKPVRLHALQ